MSFETEVVVRVPTFDEEAKEVIAGRKLVRPPTRRQGRWGGYLVEIGPQDTTPLVVLMAIKKFGPFDKDKRAYWVDGNPFNISMSNVGLAQWDIPKKKDYSPQHIDAQGGSPAYQKMYRTKNKAKLNAYHRKRYQRMRDALAAAEAQGEKRESSLIDEILQMTGADIKDLSDV